MPHTGLARCSTDVDGDGRLDLYVANDADPNQLYTNVPGGAAGLGFRLEERAKRWRVDDPNAGMGIAAADVNLDGRPDFVVTNSRGQLHAAYRSRVSKGRTSFVDVRPALSAAIGTHSTGWGASWSDLDLDGDLDLVVANGAIPVLNLTKNAQRLQVLEDLGVRDGAPRFALGGKAIGTGRIPRVNGRGLAAADYDNDGDVDLAVNSIGGKLLLVENRGAKGHWLEVQLPSFAPGAVVTAILPGGRTPRPAGARGIELSLLRGSARPLRTREGCSRAGSARALPQRHRRAPARRPGGPDRRRGRKLRRATVPP